MKSEYEKNYQLVTIQKYYYRLQHSQQDPSAIQQRAGASDPLHGSQDQRALAYRRNGGEGETATAEWFFALL